MTILKYILRLFRKSNYPDHNRFKYQQKFIQHNFDGREIILDIGSGGDPFPYSTILAERYITSTVHRAGLVLLNGKPMIVCDIHNLPFGNKQIDYIVCCHVLEHVENPSVACQEMIRVSKAGFIETPRLIKDALFCWAEFIHHKWYIEKINNRLVFFEYNDRLKKGIQSKAWHDVIFGSIYHPLQDAFNDNQEIFNIFLEWNNEFNFSVFRLNGETENK